jgi:dihydroneopterin aldolase
MTQSATIELRDLHLATTLGTYRPKDLVPDAHILDLTLTIASDLVLVWADEMALVFDYDPLIAQIDEISRSKKYETQEYLMTLIAQSCAQYEQIVALDISLKKQPVLGSTGTLGVRLRLGIDDMIALRQRT